MKQEFVSFTLAIQVKENCLFIAKHENLLLIQLLWLGLVSVWICLLANSLETRDVCFVLFCCDWCTISAWNANSLRLIYWMRSEWNKKNHRFKTPTLFSAPNNTHNNISRHSQMCWQIIHARKWDFFLPNSIYSMINSSNYMAFISSALCALWDETMAFFLFLLFIHEIRRRIGSDFSISFWCINFGWFANFSYLIH